MNKDEDKASGKMYEIIHGIVTGILIPLTVYLVNEINANKKDLADYKVVVAQEMGNKVYRADLDRLENKIDDLRNLVISEVVKRNNK